MAPVTSGGRRGFCRRLGLLPLAMFALPLALALGGCRAKAPTSGPAPPTRPRPPDRKDGAPLPEYSLYVAGGRMDPLPAPAGYPYAVLVQPAERVEIVLRPASPVQRRPHSKIFWVLGDRVKRWDVRWTSERGHASIRYRGQGESPLGAGSGQLTAVVSHVDDIPDDPAAEWLRRPPAHWRVKSYPVRWP